MTPAPLVSILTCSYNHRDYIRACAESVLRQSHEKWEWLIFDDGSTDGTVEYLETLNDARIQVRRGEHLGADHVLERKNKLLSDANGEWIAFLDSDDVWIEQRLEKQLRATANSDAVLVHGDIWLINAKGERKRRLSPHTLSPILVNDPVGAAAIEGLAALNFPVFSNVALVRKSALSQVGGFRPGMALWDYSMFLDISLLGPFQFVPEPLACWRRHAAQTSIRLDRLTQQYDAHLSRASEFFQSHRRVLERIGCDAEQMRLSQRKIILKTRSAAAVIRADSFLDIGAWPEARMLYGRYLGEILKSETPLIFRIGALAALGYFSSVLRVNLIRPAAAAVGWVRRAVCKSSSR